MLLTVPTVAAQLVAPAEVNCCVTPRSRLTAVGEIVCGGMGISVTLALAEPPGPVAVTVTAVEAGMVAGAVYRPAEEMVPAVAVQLVAPAEVNCCDCPNVTEAEVGEMTCGVCGTRVTEALAEPPGPVAVTVTNVEAGMVAGPVYKPAEVMVPAVAAQLAAPAEVNCCVFPNLTEAEVGEIACGATKETENAGPHKVPGLATWNATVAAVVCHPPVFNVVPFTYVVVILLPLALTVAPG